MPNLKRQEMRAAADTGRPKVGPADPATVRRMLAEHERKSREESRAGLYQDRRPKPKVRTEPSQPVGGYGGRMRRRAIDRVVDE